MRYSKEHAEEVRRRLIREGGRQIKERGVVGAGVDGIARGLGLSGAALYSHFESKEEFLRAILTEELGATARRLLATGASVEDVFASYLSLGHARAAAPGCALPAITADVARGSAELREAFSEGFFEIVDAFEQQLGDRALTLAVLSAAVGAVALARALPSDRAASELLESTRRLISSHLAASAADAAKGVPAKPRKAARPTKKRAAPPARKTRTRTRA